MHLPTCASGCLVDQGKAAEAGSRVCRAIQLMPNNPVMLQTIEDSKTLARLRETLKTEPAPEIHVEMAQILTAKDKSKMREHYLAALKLKPEAPDILNKPGMAAGHLHGQKSPRRQPGSPVRRRAAN